MRFILIMLLGVSLPTATLAQSKHRRAMDDIAFRLAFAWRADAECGFRRQLYLQQEALTQNLDDDDIRYILHAVPRHHETLRRLIKDDTRELYCALYKHLFAKFAKAE